MDQEQEENDSASHEMIGSRKYRKLPLFPYPSMDIPAGSWSDVNAFIADMEKDTKYNWKDLYELRLRGNNRQYAYFKCIYCPAQINLKTSEGRVIVKKFDVFHRHKKDVFKKNPLNILQIFEDQAIIDLNHKLNANTFKSFMKAYVKSLAFYTDFSDEKQFKITDVQNKQNWIVKEVNSGYVCSCFKGVKNVPCQHIISVLKFLNCENYKPFVKDPSEGNLLQI